ncbi:adenylate/guanylate cyclase domain-containing protein [Dactylosporangium sp. AC04546]|uniref:adenylate/guanylate cyclase domain-containing protein n=1 Tax=Dactylosporangium sp. AC04546 TaxID=2862460 RepID=UPI0027DF2154|nr:adenylate/guanylate cyclase domain-containing protein [Dactylosporangium sp. AC04546]WVK83686.1 adenylate/guanylate cyclase domain-containing protein [Dactylosporangium sp. AC04546]
MPRVIVWAVHLALPIAGLWLLLTTPGADVIWQHHQTHFWLVVTVAAVNVAIGTAMSVAAQHRADGRLFLVSLVFLSAAGFLFAHALATPGVLIGHPNAGFDAAMAVGLIFGSVLAVLSSLRLPTGITRWQLTLRAALGLLLFAWVVVSVLDLPPLNRQTQVRDVEGALVWASWVAVALYVIAAIRFYSQYRRSPSAVLISIVTAFVLLAESMINVTLADKWRLSWWEWHIILTLAFLFVGYSAYVQYRREGTAAGLFDGIAVAETKRRIRAQYAKALEELVDALQDSERGAPAEQLAARMAERFGLTEMQAAVLDRAAAALLAERQLSGQLNALVTVGEQARVGQGEAEFLRAATSAVEDSFGPVEVGLMSNNRLDLHGDDVLPLTVKGQVAGAVRIPPGGRPELRATLANQLSIGLENSRLYGELSTLFRQYMSPDVVAALLADPDQAALGGQLVDVTALFADLRGFTTFSEAVEPGDIVEMLNRYHGVAVPCILDNGGTIVQFVGDALLALFNAPARQADHEARAVRAALQMQAAVREIADGRPDWPRFRVGANTGPALVGNIGSELLRGFNAMGDAVNVAARLQTIAEPGQVVIGGATYDALPAVEQARTVLLGDLEVKGRRQTVRAYVVQDGS